MSDEIHLSTRAAMVLTERFQPLVGVVGIKRVLLSRVWPQEVSLLPAGVVYAADDDLAYGPGLPGRRRVRRTVPLRFVTAFARPAGPVNAFEVEIGVVKTHVERIVGADPFLTTETGPLLSDLKVVNTRSGFDPSSGSTLTVIAVAMLGILDHIEGDPTRPLPLSRHRAA